MRKRMLGTWGVAVAVGLLALGGASEAASVNSLFNLDGVTMNELSDESAEYVSNGGATINDVKASFFVGNDEFVTLAVGDVLRGMFDFNTVNGDDIGASGNDSLQGIFSTKVISFADLDGIGGANDIVFGADPNFGAWLSAIHTAYGQTDSTTAFPMIGGEVARLFTHGTPPNDYDATSVLTGSPDANIATATDGAFFWDLGFASTNDLWYAFNAVTAIPLGASTGFSLANANLTLSQMFKAGQAGVRVIPHAVGVNPLGLATSALVDFDGSTTIRGSGSSTNAGFHATNNVNLNFLAVPVPAAAWLGLGMLGLLGLGRLRRRK